MGFVQTVKNIWKIEDLRMRLLITLGFIAIYRFGSFVVLPGVNPLQLEALQANASSGLLGLLDMFSGGAFANASIFALGIMPYISASIVMQLLGIAVPAFQKMQREGESGRTKMNQYTRYLTVAILLFQGPAYIYGALGSAIPGGLFDWVIPSTIISFIILIGIIARLPHALVAEFDRLLNAPGGLVLFLLEIIFLMVVIAGAIMLVQGTRKIPVQYAKRIVGNKQYGGVRQYIPLKVNAANVMPIIFAQAIMFIPLTIAQFSVGEGGGFWASLMNYTSFSYNFIFALLIIAFTYFYTAITVNPIQMAEDLKRNNGFIPGVKPGKRTAEYIDLVMSRITFPGSLFLALVAIMPAFAGITGINSQFAQFFGGTSLLILVGVVLDTLQQIESHLLMRHYDGFLKSGAKIKGRSGSIAAY
jgi:preprotein translocase subunit SecY